MKFDSIRAARRLPGAIFGHGSFAVNGCGHLEPAKARERRGAVEAEPPVLAAPS